MKNKISSRYKVTKGPLMIMRTSVVTVLFLAAALSASSGAEKERMNKIESKLRSIINKAGINFNGTFRSQYLNSVLDENSGDSVIDWGRKTTESNEYTSVDFDISARPNDALSGRLIFRMHQNWQNIWSDISNPIFSRWISIDGNIQNMFRFNVGDFRQKFSPLTLWSPDIDIAYEPEIFAARRQEAMKEVFLGDNDRLLQGVNFNLDAELVPIFNELHVNLHAARLRLEGANYGNGNAVAAAMEASKMDRYVTGGNLDLIALRGLGVGGTVFGIFDLAPTFNGSVADARLTARSGLIAGVRLNPTTAIFLDSDVFTIGLNFEAVSSINRDSAWYTGTDSTLADLETTSLKGMAIDAGISGAVTIGEATIIDVSVGFMKNDRDFYNEMAQSPTFLGQRIMNSENDGYTGALYSTFDALYHYVFKFTPTTTPTGANAWTKMPRRKISYTNGIMTVDEIDSMAAGDAAFFVAADPALQTVLPFGPATPNRIGPKGELKVNLFDGGIDIGGSFAMLSEAESAVEGAEKTKFTKVGGGLCIDVATWVKPLNSLKLSVGYSMENSKNGADESNNGFLNLGLSYNFWKRFSLLGGYQQIDNQTMIDALSYDEEVVQSQWAAGLEYRVSEASVVTGRFGQVAVDYEDTDQSFKQWQHELFLTVDF
ncbi:MAG: hypothetical protein JW863_03600 [Chitinispirillaceae bacterium]|nr:hypothetical protein [Chitinispirillaceae bacterium]